MKTFQLYSFRNFGLHVSGVGNATSGTSTDQARVLVSLCRTGKLYEIADWILAGKSLDISTATKRGRQKSLIEVTVETGFHSLVELIAKHCTNRLAKNIALHKAVESRRLDLIEVLLENGADIRSIPLADALLTWDPKLIRFFLDHGADPLEGRPFAEAFGAKVRTVLRPFLEYKRTHPEIAAPLQEQLDCAIRFLRSGRFEIGQSAHWTGGDPRSTGPCLGKEYTEDPECYTTGLEEACCSENYGLLGRKVLVHLRDNGAMPPLA
jgi:hypothetical protein